MALSLGLGLGLSFARSGGGRPAWAPENALFALETIPSGRRYRCGAPVNVNATGGYALNAAGVLVPFAANTPRMTDLGLLVESSSTNKLAVRNASPVDLSQVQKSGDAASVLTLFDDSAIISTSSVAALCSGMVFRLDNSAGVALAAITILPGQGNSNAHTRSAFVRGGSGGIGFNVATRTQFGPSTSYRQVENPNNLAGIGTSDTRVYADAGQVIYVILPMLEERTSASSPIITTGSPATRAADTLTILDIPAGTYDLHLRYASGSDRVVAGWAANDPLPFDNRQITMVWGVAA